MAPVRRNSGAVSLEPVAGNGLLDRRLLLKSGMVFAGAMTTSVAGTPFVTVQGVGTWIADA